MKDLAYFKTALSDGLFTKSGLAGQENKRPSISWRVCLVD
jgi:hypothetical protein